MSINLTHAKCEVNHGEPKPRRLPFNGTLLAVIVLIVQLCVFTATLWVSAGYVAKPDFEAYKNEQGQRRDANSAELKGVAVSIGHMDDQGKQNDRQDRRLEEIEHRITELERRK